MLPPFFNCKKIFNPFVYENDYVHGLNVFLLSMLALRKNSA